MHCLVHGNEWEMNVNSNFSFIHVKHDVFLEVRNLILTSHQIPHYLGMSIPNEFG